MRTLLLAAALPLLAAPPPPGTDGPRTPNDLYARGVPTLVVGTAGNGEADRRIRVQAELVRGMLFPSARILPDTAIDLAEGRSGWPPRPVLYGGPRENRVVANLAPALSLEMGRGKLTLGEEAFAGPGIRLLALVPGNEDRPAFVLYAGVSGVAEINATPHGSEPLLVADRFGPLAAGTWRRGEGGKLVPVLGPRRRRYAWRDCGFGIRRLELDPPDDADQAEDAAIRRGIARVRERFRVEMHVPVTVHVYPDRGSKRALTGNAGDGHADVLSGTLHVLPFAPERLEELVAHEAAHVIADATWGPAATPLLGEGLAVWAAGSYGGRTLEEWRRSLPAPGPTLEELLGPGFRRLAEARSYPRAGILVGTLLGLVGEKAFRTHLLATTPRTFEEDCRAAGTTRKAVAEAFRAAFD